MRLVVTVLLLTCLSTFVWADLPPPREVRAARCHDLKIDGVLEPEWLQGGVADSFVQSRPVEGALASLPTRAYVMYDNDALYVSFLCLDSAPDSISGRVLRRDNYERSDFVNLTLDPFHDHRNGYMFVVTASGVQTDATVANETNTDDAWDGLWQSAVGRTDSGWVAEVRIPFQTIRHGGARADGWGINFNRGIDRRQENAWWQPVNRERGFRMNEAGVLKGLEGIASSRHIEVLPHVVGRWDAGADSSRWHSRNPWQNLGAYLKVVPSGAWTMDLAYQPDFAQVEVDDEVINLSDYPVYLTEKRPFFIESKELFDFAPISLFYTRRVTDPDYGGRLNVQQERFRVSALAAKNVAADSSLQDMGAGRATWNLGRVSTLGFTGTYLGQRGFHAAAGSVDARIRWRERDRLTLALAGVDRSGHNEQPLEAYAGIFRDFGIFGASASVDFRGKDYNINDLGWDYFSNALVFHSVLSKDYFPKTAGFQKVGYELQVRRQTMTDDSHLESFLDASLYATTRENLQMQLSAEFGNWYRRNYGTPLPRLYRDNFGDFRPEFHAVSIQQIWLATDSRKPVELEFTANWGTFYEGYKWGGEPALTVKPRENFDLMAAMSWDRVWGAIDVDSTRLARDFRVLRVRARYSPTLNIALRATVQWREDTDAAAANLLLAWNWRTGSWFYLVYDETGRPTDPRLSYDRPGDRTVRLKWTYYFSVG